MKDESRPSDQGMTFSRRSSPFIQAVFSATAGGLMKRRRACARRKQVSPVLVSGAADFSPAPIENSLEVLFYGKGYFRT
jgi:hypothetical protein